MAHLPDESKINFKISGKFKTVSLALIGVGIVLIALQFLVPWQPHGGGEAHGYPKAFASLLMGLLVAISLSLGGVYFVAFNHLAGSAWNVTVRRLAESYFWYLPVALIMMALVFLGVGDVYHHWVHGDPEDHLLQVKAPWLNTTFFIARNLVWVLVWILFGYLFYKHSIAQDKDGEVSHTLFVTKLGAGFLVVFGLTYSFNAWDLTMSLEPHWFSTMWAVYSFAGLALTVFASLILWVWYLKKSGYYGDSLNENHVHDLGKYLWGHTIFWGYIMISQFLLIWYGHIPEETMYYHTRLYTEDMQYNAWAIVSLLLVVVRFILPFFLIIRRESKRNLNYLASIAALVIFGQLVDLYWMIYPTIDHGHFILPSIFDLGPIFFVAGSFMLIVGTVLSKNPLIPVKDPRLEDCLHWHQ